jgi:hypothetical protein
MTSPTIADAITRIADIAEQVGRQANIGASETAGQMLSYLAAHPDQIEPLLKDGVFRLPERFWEHGRLTWTSVKGEIVSPGYVRQCRVIDRLIASGGRA